MSDINKVIEVQNLENRLGGSTFGYHGDQMQIRLGWAARIDEKLHIDKLSKEYALLNAANKNSQLVVTEYYSKYIVLIFITILLRGFI